MTEDVRQRLSHDEILTASRALIPNIKDLLEFKAKSNENQGSTSLLLCVRVTLRQNDLSITDINMVIKLPSLVPSVRDLLEKGGYSKREVMFFREVLPILKKRCLNLPLVECNYCDGSMIAMEDLRESGFEIFVREPQTYDDGLISIEHVKTALASLAKMHASSLETDWLTILPELHHDITFNDTFPGSIKKLIMSGSRCIALVIQHLLLKEKYEKHVSWLENGVNLFNAMGKLVKCSPGKLNVICHGDFYLNNMMFRNDPKTGDILEAKFFDFQFFRFAQPSTDIHYFFNMNLNKKFLEANEKLFLSHYVETFKAASQTKHLDLESFYDEYESTKLFGLGISAMCLPFRFYRRSKLGQQMSLKMEDILDLNYTDIFVNIFRDNPEFVQPMVDLAEEFISFLDASYNV